MSILEQRDFVNWLEESLAYGEEGGGSLENPGQFSQQLGEQLGLTSDQAHIYLNHLLEEVELTGDRGVDSEEIRRALSSEWRICRQLPMFLGNLDQDGDALEALTLQVIDGLGLEYRVFTVFSEREPDVRAHGGVPWTIELTHEERGQHNLMVVHSPNVSRHAVEEQIRQQLFELEGRTGDF